MEFRKTGAAGYRPSVCIPCLGICVYFRLKEQILRDGYLTRKFLQAAEK